MINRGKLKASKRRMSTQPRRGYACKWCGSGSHYSLTCFSRPQKPLRKEAKKTKGKRLGTRARWLDQNPPDRGGNWSCYLNIAPNCYRVVNIQSITFEHVRPRARHERLRFREENVKAACEPCNKLKGPWELADLAATYPHIFDMITTPEWSVYEKSLDALEELNPKALQ